MAMTMGHRWQNLDDALASLKAHRDAHGYAAVADEIAGEIQGGLVEFANRATIYPSRLLWLCFDNNERNDSTLDDSYTRAAEMIRDAYAKRMSKYK